MKYAKLAAALALAALLVVALVVVLSARDAGLTLTFTADDLQQRLESRFPVQQKLPLVTTTFRDPRVILTDGSDRIGLRITASAEIVGQKEFTGNLLVDGELRYVPQDGAFYFDNARVQDVEIPGLSEDTKRQVRTVASLLINLYLSHVPIYRLKPEDIRQALAKTVLKSVSVRNGRLIVELGITP